MHSPHYMPSFFISILGGGFIQDQRLSIFCGGENKRGPVNTDPLL